MTLFLNKSFYAIRSSDESELTLVLTDGYHRGLRVTGISLLSLFSEAQDGITEKIALEKLHVLGIHNSEEALDALIKSGVFVNEDAHSSRWVDFGWLEPLMFHRAIRNSRFLEYVTSTQDKQPSLTREKARNDYLQAEPPPSLTIESDSRHICLPPPERSVTSLTSLLANRRTIRDFTPSTITKEALGSVLATGCARLRVNRREQENKENFFSHSDLIPFELFCVIHRVSNLEPGVYRYHVDSHELSLVNLGDYEEQVAHCIWGQPMGYNNSFSLFLTAVFERYQYRYRSSRGYMNLLVGLGEFGQYLILAAHNYGLGACMTPALRDNEISKHLRIDGKKRRRYIISESVCRRTEKNNE